MIIQLKCICHGIYIAIRILFNLPRQTHRYIIKSISESIHVKTMLYSRFVSFCDSLCKSFKLSIRLFYNLSLNDYRTVLCTNILNISRECNVERLFLNKSCVKSVMKYADSADHAWRIPLFKKLLLGAIIYLKTILTVVLYHMVVLYVLLDFFSHKNLYIKYHYFSLFS